MKSNLINIVLFTVILTFCHSTGYTQDEIWSPLTSGVHLNFTGKVGIGTSVPDKKLTVAGKIHAERVKVDLNVPWPDYVFHENYNLRNLEELEKFISMNKHLPEIPSAKEMMKEGVSLSVMSMLLQKKAEELTLYIIEHENRLNNIEQKINHNNQN